MPEELQNLLGPLLIAGPFLCILGVVFLAFLGLFVWLLGRGAFIWQDMRKIIQKATPLEIGQLTPGQGIARIHGTISEIDQPIQLVGEPPLALLRLQIDGATRLDDTSGRHGLAGKTVARPFALYDGSGSVWIDPNPPDLRLMDDGVTPTQEQLAEAARVLGINLASVLAHSYNVRSTLWKWPQNQPLNVIGPVVKQAGNTTIGRLKPHKMLISPLELASIDLRSARSVNAIFIIIGGLLLLLCVCPALCLAPNILSYVTKLFAGQ